MKPCRKFKQILLTDYLDHELSPEAEAAVAEHLQRCASCRVFFEQLEKEVQQPLAQAPKEPAPESIWLALKEELTAQPKKSWAIPSWGERWQMLLRPATLGYVLSGVILCLMIGTGFSYRYLQQVKEREQIQYLVSIWSPSSMFSEAENHEEFTAIEEYFL